MGDIARLHQRQYALLVAFYLRRGRRRRIRGGGGSGGIGTGKGGGERGTRRARKIREGHGRVGSCERAHVL